MPRPIPHLSIVVPAYNEQAHVLRTIDAVLGWLTESGIPGELVLVDDGSADATPRLVAERAAAEPALVPVLLPANGGKGAALKAGVAAARGSNVVFFDSDLSYPLAAIDQALARIGAGADLAIGARDLAQADSRRAYALPRRLATRAFGFLVRSVLGLPERDTQCGFKAFRGDVARALFAALTVPGFAFDAELLFLAHRWRLRIDLLPVTMVPGNDSSVRVLRHGWRMATDLLRVRWRALRGRYPGRPAHLANPT